MDKFPYLGAIHGGMIEQMYSKYLQDPKSINNEWSNFFQGFDFAKEVYSEEDIPKVFQKEFNVYDRQNKKCLNKKCKSFIKKMIISNRSTYYCQKCQK